MAVRSKTGTASLQHQPGKPLRQRRIADTAELAAYITGADYPAWPPYADPVPVDASGDSVVDRLVPDGDQSTGAD